MGWIRYLGRFVVLGLAIVAVVLIVDDRFGTSPQAPNGKGLSGPENVDELRVSYAEAVDKAAPAVVNIYVDQYVQTQPRYLFNSPGFRQFTGQTRPRQVTRKKLGSGVIISPDGYIMTNFHVIEDADDINIALWDGRQATAEIIGSDPDTDLAVLKISLENLPSIQFARNNDTLVGDVVLAIGNPLGLGKTVTLGIVSATGRSDLNISLYEDFIQTDAAINQGNSGGALVNSFGQLIGINTAMYGRSRNAEGIGFAIPIETAQNVMQEIILNGYVTRGWLGVDMLDGTQFPQLTDGIEQKDGVVIINVYRDSPAFQSGIRPGDYITSVNREDINSINRFYRAIASSEPGGETELIVWREGRPFSIKTKLVQRPDVSTPSA